MKTEITLTEASTLIRTCGVTNTFIFQGEPGIGKSAMLEGLRDEGHSVPVYIDCALLDLGDLQMPVPAEDRSSVSFVPNSMFRTDSTKPVTVMLDEIGKASRPVQNALLTLLHEKRVGNHYLPPNSVVFGTTNLATDGVGDLLQAHAKNRVSFLTIKKPDAESWINWAVTSEAKEAPELLAWVNEYPHCLDSYTHDNGSDNPYIFNPKRQQNAFVTPRSLFNASQIVAKRHKLPPDAALAALAGTIGEPAARDMQAFLNVADSLPSWKSIVANPGTAPVPDNPVANTISVLKAVTSVTSVTVSAWMEYMLRLPAEAQFLFASQAMRSPNAPVVVVCQEFTDWARENSWAV